MTRHRVTFEIEGRELDDFTRLGVCTPPKQIKVEPAETDALRLLRENGFVPDRLAPRPWVP